jgi:hypothetical protein
VVIAFSIVDRKSFEKAETRWHLNHKDYGKEVPCVLLGLKEDLRNQDSDDDER